MPRLTAVERTRFGDFFDLQLSLDGNLEGKKVRALIYKPVDYRPSARVVVVMHGVTRAADQYMASWMMLAEKCGFLLIVPEFSSAYWPRSRSYNLGNMQMADGTIRSRQDWSFTILDHLVDEALTYVGSTASQFALYGHSAGAQFVHRYVLFTGGNRLRAAIVANAGWYTLPSSETGFPYGIADIALGHDILPAALAAPLTILLGGSDTNQNDTDLRRTPKALMQGPHRLARGRYFHSLARTIATRQDLLFNWDIIEVAGVGHNDRDLAPIAAQILCRDTQTSESYAA